jgi:hypothetical protein
VKAWRRIFSTVAERKCKSVTIFKSGWGEGGNYSDLVFHCQRESGYRLRPQNVTGCGHVDYILRVTQMRYLNHDLTEQFLLQLHAFISEIKMSII